MEITAQTYVKTVTVIVVDRYALVHRVIMFLDVHLPAMML